MAFQQHSLKEYNNSSAWQLDVALHLVDSFTQILRESSSSPESFLQIADYGSSEGLNSMIFFEKCIRNLRETSDKELFIVHTDLPENNWVEFNKVFTTSPNSYLTLPGTNYSTIGRSFFNQLFPANSIHIGFSSLAFHYLSKKAIRAPGDTEILHKGIIEQANKDIRTILRHRITELRHGGTLIVLSGTSSLEPSLNLQKLHILAIQALINRGVITEEKIKQMDYNTSLLSIEDWNIALSEFSDEIEVIKVEANKYICPFYKKYLEDRNLERYVEDLTAFLVVLSKWPIFSVLDCDDEGKDRAYQISKEETRRIVAENIAETHMNFATIIFRKR